MLKELTGMPPGIQALEAVGTVTAEDYQRIFASMVDRARRTESRMRLLYQFGPSFQRITPGALWADARLGFAYLRLLDGCAIASDIAWIRTSTRSIGAWLPCPVRVYHNDERDDALTWLAALPKGTNVSARDVVKAYIGGACAGAANLAKGVFSQRSPITRIAAELRELG